MCELIGKRFTRASARNRNNSMLADVGGQHVLMPRQSASPYFGIALTLVGFAVVAGIVSVLPIPGSRSAGGLAVVSGAMAVAVACLHVLFWTTSDFIQLSSDSLVIRRSIMGVALRPIRLKLDTLTARVIMFPKSLYPFPLVEMRDDRTTLRFGHGKPLADLQECLRQLSVRIQG
jgi:hypothetical protein